MDIFERFFRTSDSFSHSFKISKLSRLQSVETRTTEHQTFRPQVIKVLNTLRFAVPFCLFSIAFTSHAQTEKIQALKKEFSLAKADSTKCRILLELGNAYLDYYPDSTEFWANQAIVIALEKNNFKALGQAHNTIGIGYLNQSKTLRAIDYFHLAREYYLQAQDYEGEAKMLNNLGVIYTQNENHPKAIENFEQAYELAQRINHPLQISYALYNLAINNSRIENLEKAKTYALELRKLNSIHPETLGANAVLADIFVREEQLDSALLYITKQLDLIKKEQDLYYWTSCTLTRADILLRQKLHGKAYSTILLAEPIILQNNFSELKVELLRLKANYNKAIGQEGLALQLFEQYAELKDSLDRENRMNFIHEVNAKYEVDQMEEQLEAQAQKLSLNRIVAISTAAIAVTLLIGLIIVFISLRKNRKLTKLLKVKNSEITQQRQKIISSINYAKRIQQSTLPDHKEIAEIFDEAFIYFQPKDIISGDFYSYVQIDGKTYLAAVDCTGHGVPGAFMSLIAHAKLNRVLIELGERDPGKILTAMHHEIRAALHQESEADAASQDGVEMSLCVIDHHNKTIEYSGAGCPVIVCRDGKCFEYKGSYYGLGGSDLMLGNHKLQFETTSITFEKGDVLYMFSDGLLDQLGGEKRKKLNKSNFQLLLKTLIYKGFSDAKEQCDTFIKNWRQSEPQTDDIMLIGVKL